MSVKEGAVFRLCLRTEGKHTAESSWATGTGHSRRV